LGILLTSSFDSCKTLKGLIFLNRSVEKDQEMQFKWQTFDPKCRQPDRSLAEMPLRVSPLTFEIGDSPVIRCLFFDKGLIQEEN